MRRPPPSPIASRNVDVECGADGSQQRRTTALGEASPQIFAEGQGPCLDAGKAVRARCVAPLAATPESPTPSHIGGGHGTCWTHEFVVGYARLGRRSTARFGSEGSPLPPSFGASLSTRSGRHYALFRKRCCGDGVSQDLEPQRRLLHVPQRLRHRSNLPASVDEPWLREPSTTLFWRSLHASSRPLANNSSCEDEVFPKTSRPCLDAGHSAAIEPPMVARSNAGVARLASQA